MGYRRSDEWEENSKVYTAEQLEAVLEYAGVEVVSDTYTHFLCYCPFHGNSDTPAFAVDKTLGKYHCFNPSCEASGEIEEMLRLLRGLNPFEAKRLLLKYEKAVTKTASQRVEEALARPPMFVEFPQSSIDRLREQFPGSVGEKYMMERHFTADTLSYFEVGYSEKKNMVVVPMHDPTGMPIGFIGRTPSHNPADKQFKNSVNLPKSLTAWNFHRAKHHGDTVVIVEASYDAMRVHQAGYPNVIALLGGSVSDEHISQIAKTFSRVIIMTDFDDKQRKINCRRCDYKPCVGHRPGRDLGRTIANKLPTKKILWAAYDDNCVYPAWPLEGYRRKPAKDVGDMSDEEIRQCLRNAVSSLVYEQEKMEEKSPELVA